MSSEGGTTEQISSTKSAVLLPDTDRLQQVDDCVKAFLKTSHNLSLVRYFTKPQIWYRIQILSIVLKYSAVIGGVIAAVVIVLTAVVVVYVVCARRRILRYYINVYVLNVNSIYLHLVVSIIIVLYVQSDFEL
jgi:hypothetical protein